jgi:2-deoxy-D-gluconate 3-dehydrogenase
VRTQQPRHCQGRENRKECDRQPKARRWEGNRDKRQDRSHGEGAGRGPGSVDALHPSSVGLAHYDASTHGVWGLTKNLALELAPHRIWVNAIAPGGIVTPGVSHMSSAPGVDQQEILQHFLARIPMGRMGEPDEIGMVALFLASDMSSYMTGTQVVVDGGVLLA